MDTAATFFNTQDTSLAFAFNAQQPRVLGTGLLKNGEPYALVLQTQADMADMLALQDKVIDALPADRKFFIAYKSRDVLENHLAGGGMALGIRHRGRLVAQCVIVNPTPQAPATGLSGVEHFAPGGMSVLQGVLVDPAFRGQGLMQKMVVAWMEMSAQNGRRNVFAKVSANNTESWTAFMKKGMKILSVGTREDNGRPFFNMHAFLPDPAPTFAPAPRPPAPAAAPVTMQA